MMAKRAHAKTVEVNASWRWPTCLTPLNQRSLIEEVATSAHVNR